jgi:hypothetical protein
MVSVAGLTVTHQEFSPANLTLWMGHGILGLAFSNLTYIYNALEPCQDVVSDPAPYNPFFYLAVKQDKIKPCELLLQNV